MKISYSVMPTALTEPLRSGEVVPEGLELLVFEPKTTDANSRDMIDLKFDVAEMSIATFVKAVERGLPLAALPVFTSGRRFVQSGFYFAVGSELRALGELRGNVVGLPQYWISSCIWQRMALKEMYGISPEEAQWVSTEPERFEGVGVPPGVPWRLETDRSLVELARDGGVDACSMQGGRPLPADLAAVTIPAFEDCVTAEREYYLASHLFPLMHVTVIQRRIPDEDQTVVPGLLEAYSRAKEIAVSREGGDWSLPPAGHSLEALRALLGDPFPYGIAANRDALEAFVAGAVDQGLLGRKLGLDELFVGDLPEAFR